MLKKMTPILILVCALLLVPHAWGLDFQEGQYEITSTVKMPGMPMQIPPTTITECVTQEDPVPNQQNTDGNCKILDMQTKGNTVTWQMECDQQGQKVKSSGRMKYQGDRFDGTADTVVNTQGGAMKMTTTIKGKRVGDCQ